MKLALRIVAMSCLVALATAHLCMISPSQRGTQPNGEAADSSCYRRTPYCGGVEIENPPPQNTYVAGQTVSIKFQQNLNHFSHAKPGFFDVSFTDKLTPTENDFSTLWKGDDFPMFEMLTQTSITIPVTIPNTACDHCIMRVRYFSYNKDEVDPSDNTDAVFYNCADVRVIKPQTSTAPETFNLIEMLLKSRSVATPSAAEVIPSSTPTFSCKAADRWTAQGFETNAFGSVKHSVAYDGVKKMIRWERSGNLYKAGVTNSIVMLTHYDVADSAPVNEYVIQDGGKCEVRGADHWYDWGYGPDYNMVHVRSTEMKNGDTVAEWANKSGLFHYSARMARGSAECQPLSRSMTVGPDSLVFAEVSSNVDQSVFEIPAECQKGMVSVAEGNCGGGHEMKALRMQMFGGGDNSATHIVL